MRRDLALLGVGVFLLMGWLMGAGGAAQSVPCFGCTGTPEVTDGNVAAPPCSTSKGVPGDWEVAITVYMEDGLCEVVKKKQGQVGSCLEDGCKTSVTYAWGQYAAGGLEKVGYERVTGAQRPHTELVFEDGKPWTEGEFGQLSFDYANSPEIPCGAAVQYFLAGDLCGPFFASVEAGCGNCWSTQPPKEL